MSEETLRNLKNTFKGLASIIGIIKNLFSSVYRSIKPLLTSMGESGLIGKILGVTGAFGRWLYIVNKTIISNDTLYKGIQIGIYYVKKAIKAVSDFADNIRKNLHLPEVGKVKQGFLEFFELIKTKFSEFGKHTTEGIKKLCDKLSGSFKNKIDTPALDDVNEKLDKTEGVLARIANSFKAFRDKIVNGLKALGNAIKNSKIGQFFIALFKGIWNILKTIGAHIGNIISNLTEDISKGDFSGLLNIVKIIATGGVAVSIKKFFDTLSTGANAIKAPFEALKGISGIFSGIKGALNGVQGCLEAYQSKLKSDVLLKIAIAIAILAASIVALSLIDPDKLDVAVGGLTVLFADLMGSMAIFNKISGSAKKTSKLTSALISMSVAVLILSIALKKVASISEDDMNRGILGITEMSAVLVGVAKLLSSNEKKMTKGASSMIVFSLAVKILASVCKTLSQLSWEELLKGLAGVTTLLLEIFLFLRTGKFNSKKMVSTSMGMILIATAVRILASSCKAFASLDWEGIVKGLIGVGVILGELALFINGIDNKKIFVSSIALVAMGLAMKIMASVCKSLAGLEWEELAKGLLAFYAILIGLATFITDLDDKKIFTSSISLILMGAAMKIMASVCRNFASFKWEELAKGLTGLGVLLLELSLFISSLDNKKLLASSVGLIVIGEAIKKLISSCAKLSGMSWEELLKGLVGIGAILTEIALFSKITSGSKGLIKAGTAMVLMGSGLKKFASVLKIMGELSIKELVTALAALASVFVIIGVAGKLLGPMVPALLGLAGALTLIGVAMVAFGAGLLLVGAGLATIVGTVITLGSSIAVISTSIASAIAEIVRKVVDLIPYIIKKIGEGLIELIKMLDDSVPLLMTTIKDIVLSLLGLLNECAPVLIDSIVKLIVGILDATVEYAPVIVEKLFDLFILILKKVAEKLPELIDAVIEVIASFFKGIFDAFNNMDAGTFESMLSGINVVAEMLLVLAGLGALAAPAMAGVIALGALVLELTGVLAALGALEQLPGLNWIIGEGGKLLGVLGEAIGSFLGGILGSALEGVASTLPKVGENLSDFFEKAEPFINGAGKLNASSMDGIKALVDVMLMLTGANILESLTAWLTGSNSLSKFGEELAAFGPSLNTYYNSIKGIKGNVVQASADAASALAQMAKKLPKHGGLLEWFTGSATLTTFAKELLSFGPAMKSYYLSIKDIKSDVVTASADAASSLAEMAQKLPKHGGLLEWFTGGATLTTFATELLSFGPAMKSYYFQVKDIKGDVVTASANAAASLAEMAQKLPAHGGVVKWFTGDATLTTFATELLSFGPAMQAYSDAVKGIKPEAVEASANAALMLTEVNKNLPETGGLRGFINGDKSLVEFANGLSDLGPAIKKYAEGSEGFKGENLEALKASIEVVKALAKINQELPEVGGLKQFVEGEKDLGKWVVDLDSVGEKIKKYADNVDGINIDGLYASITALYGLSLVNQNIPEVGGLKQFVVGSKSLGNWVVNLDSVGEKIKKYADNVDGINIDGLYASITALYGLSLVNQNIPEVGGLKQLVVGEKSLSKWVTDLGTVGTNIKEYANNVFGIKTDGLSDSVDAIETLAKANSFVPSQGGFNKLFTGEQSLSQFGHQLAQLGLSLYGFCNSMDNVDADKMTKASDVILALAKSAQALVGAADEHEFDVFSTSIPKMADGVKLLYANLYNAGLIGSTEGFKKAIDILVDLVKIGIDLNKMDYKRVYENFGESLGKMASDGLDTFKNRFIESEEFIKKVANDFVNTFSTALGESTLPMGLVTLTMTALAKYILGELDDIEDDWTESGHDMINNLSSGMYEQYSKKLSKTVTGITTMMVTDAQKNAIEFRKIGSNYIAELASGTDSKKAMLNDKADQIVTWIVIPLKGSYNKFSEIGAYLVTGFSNGILSNKVKAEEAARSMAKAASTAAEKTLDEHSPSKVGYRIGDYFGVGFINAINDSVPDSFRAGAYIAESAKRGLSKAVERINSYMDDSIDSSPIITPVLDLSELTKDVRVLDGMMSASQSMSLAKNTSAAFNSTHSVTGEIKVDNTDVVREINSLKGEVAALNGVIGNLKVVMDTGALVGTMVTPMNIALGRRAAYERRGN